MPLLLGPSSARGRRALTITRRAAPTSVPIPRMESAAMPAARMARGGASGGGARIRAAADGSRRGESVVDGSRRDARRRLVGHRVDAVGIAVGRRHPRVLVAADDVVPGTVIAADSVRTARIDADSAVMASLYGPEDLDALEGRVATASIAKGSLVTRDAVQSSDAGAAVRSMSFPIPRAHALGGALDPGDRVDILAVGQDGSDAGYVMTGVEVLAVDGRPGRAARHAGRRHAHHRGRSRRRVAACRRARARHRDAGAFDGCGAADDAPIDQSTAGGSTESSGG